MKISLNIVSAVIKYSVLVSIIQHNETQGKQRLGGRLIAG